MYAIVGLGNPTKKYENTRHNIGFMCIDALAREYDITLKEQKFKGIMGQGMIEGEKVLMIKPQTYMNLSGECVRAMLDYYRLEAEGDLLVIYDDVALPIGKLRIRPRGSAGGHNGIKNIILHTGTEDFARIRIGVGAPTGDMINHVLGQLTHQEKELIGQSLDRATEAVRLLVNRDIDKAMNLYN